MLHSLSKIFTGQGPLLKRIYWNHENFWEFIGFNMKIIIIFPGLLLGKQWWWLYILALISASLLMWSSIKKKLPTILYFNFMWFILASLSITKHWHPHMFDAFLK
jgi:hypothetical protein